MKLYISLFVIALSMSLNIYGSESAMTTCESAAEIPAFEMQENDEMEADFTSMSSLQIMQAGIICGLCTLQEEGNYEN